MRFTSNSSQDRFISDLVFPEMLGNLKHIVNLLLLFLPVVAYSGFWKVCYAI